MVQQVTDDVVSEKERPLSEYTREEILKLIEENGGPEGLDLRGRQSDLVVVVLQKLAFDSLCYRMLSHCLTVQEKLRAEVIVMAERQMVSISVTLTEAERRLRSLSPERLRVANDFLAYLQEREENEATAELLSIPGFEAAFQRAVQQAESGEVVRFEDIHRDV